MQYKIILASNSPRRAELLQHLGFSFDIHKYTFNETIPSFLPTEETAGFLSLHKANQITDINPKEIIITADTVVITHNQVLGKPKTVEDAIKYLSILSNSTHKVMSGVTIKTLSSSLTFDDTTLVTFKTLSKEEIEHYIKEHKPFDKAGAYGIQEWIGMIGIEKIEGSYYNVMGLPTHKLYKQLKNIIDQPLY